MICPEALLDRCEDYLFGRMPDEQKEEFEIHYLGCEVCVRALEASMRFIEAIRSLDEAHSAKTPPPSKQSTHRPLRTSRSPSFAVPGGAPKLIGLRGAPTR